MEVRGVLSLDVSGFWFRVSGYGKHKLPNVNEEPEIRNLLV